MIIWPPEFDPQRAPVFVSNTIETEAPPAAIWAWLIRAACWPQWYSNSRAVVLPGGEQDLAKGMTFRWRTFGVGLVSRVEEFVPHERVAWTARGLGVWAYHAWLIEPRAFGCRILTEETQHGWLARLGNLVMPDRMHRGHQQWLEGLDRVARDRAQPGDCRAPR